MNKAIAAAAAAKIQRYMDKHNIGQREMAEQAGVSQATVCRALKGEAFRPGLACHKLFIKVEFNESDMTRARDGVLTAFDGIWDYTEEHADAVARIIDALGAFCKYDKKSVNKDG